MQIAWLAAAACTLPHDMTPPVLGEVCGNRWDSYQRDYVWKDVLHWYAATVAEAEATGLLNAS